MQKKRQSRINPAGALLLLMACAAPGKADAFRVFKVDPFCPDPSVYTTIQAAVDAAAAYSDSDHADYVWISDNTDINGYKQQHIVINDPESVIIEGGFFDCTDFDPGTDQTSVSGSGNDGGPVFEIVGNGNNVYLGNLSVFGAQRAAGTKGGGVSFTGQGSLTLGTTTITNNHAGSGGGVYVEQSGGDVSLTLLANTQIAYNSADGDGGGIALVGYKPGSAGGHALLYADSADTWITFNDAGGNGGGLFVKWFANANIGSPGYAGFGVLYNNSAVNGGAIAISSPDGYPGLGVTGPMVTLYTTDANHPVRLQSNTATQFGGAVYVEAGPQLPQSNNACFVAFNFRIDDNIAPEGAAIYTEPNGGFAHVGLNRSTGECHQWVSHFPNQACAAGTTCNSIDGNGARDSLGDPTGGATILFQTLGRLGAERLSLRGNVGGNVVHTIGLHSDNSSVFIDTALIADNTVSSDLVKFAGPGYAGSIGLHDSTLTHNTIGSPNVIYAEHNLLLVNSIIDQPGRTAVGYAGPVNGLEVYGNVATDASAVGFASTLGSPTFVDDVHGDYHLKPWSLGVDFAGTVYPAIEDIDLDGNPRNVDLTSVPNAPGLILDAGAYEVQYVCAPDEVFCNGFEH